jgi:hypothetical protein
MRLERIWRFKQGQEMMGSFVSRSNIVSVCQSVQLDQLVIVYVQYLLRSRRSSMVVGFAFGVEAVGSAIVKAWSESC